MSDQVSQWWTKLRTTAEEYGIQEKLKNAGSMLDAQVRSKADEYDLQGKLNYAGSIIDRYDRKIEDIENNATSFLKQKGSEVYGKVVDSLDPMESSSEVLFEQKSAPSSRVDAQIKALHHSPELFIDRETRNTELTPEQAERKKTILTDNADLQKLHDSLVPEKVADSKFWLRYFELRDDIEEQDRQRKEILRHKPTTEDEKIDWGSSDEENDLTTVKNAAEKKTPPSTSNDAKDTVSDSDWD